MNIKYPNLLAYNGESISDSTGLIPNLFSYPSNLEFSQLESKAYRCFTIYDDMTPAYGIQFSGSSENYGNGNKRKKYVIDMWGGPHIPVDLLSYEYSHLSVASIKFNQSDPLSCGFNLVSRNTIYKSQEDMPISDRYILLLAILRSKDILINSTHEDELTGFRQANYHVSLTGDREYLDNSTYHEFGGIPLCVKRVDVKGTSNSSDLIALVLAPANQVFRISRSYDLSTPYHPNYMNNDLYGAYKSLNSSMKFQGMPIVDSSYLPATRDVFSGVEEDIGMYFFYHSHLDRIQKVTWHQRMMLGNMLNYPIIKRKPVSTSPEEDTYHEYI